MHSLVLILLFISQFISSYNVAFALTKENPFSPKGYLIRYWKNKIANDFPTFLLNKASPLTATELATLSKLAENQNTLSSNLPNFCTKANLLCFSSPALLKKHRHDVNFTTYLNRAFHNYGGRGVGGADSFKNYSAGANVASSNFRRYSRNSVSHTDNFTSYSTAANVPEDKFAGYGTTSADGGGQFKIYNSGVNKPNLNFRSYSDNSNRRQQTFTEYSNGGNSGDEGFVSYGKNGTGAGNQFSGYGKDMNVIGSNFKNYGQFGKGGKDKFNSYGEFSNNPVNKFKNYGTKGNGAVESFTSYRNNSNVGDDDFRSYGKKSTDSEAKFDNYGQSFNNGSSKFSGYGRNANDQTTDFRVYGVNTTFKGYSKKGVTFASYVDESGRMAKGKMVNKGVVVEEGKFFREAMLRSGNVMHMPDIRDKMPKRSFLPVLIASKLPFSMSRISELQKIFNAENDSSMMGMLVDSLSECERAPSPGETKRCVASIEDMIDFSTSVLGRNVTVRTTENIQGANGTIMIGQVRGIDGGKVTKSVSCHQSLFPSLLYYCHSVPTVRVYEADILNPKSKVKINNGVAICHLDTSVWSPGHGAFVSLGSGPGKIEVCHWIFENDMTWTLSD